MDDLGSKSINLQLDFVDYRAHSIMNSGSYCIDFGVIREVFTCIRTAAAILYQRKSLVWCVFFAPYTRHFYPVQG